MASEVLLGTARGIRSVDGGSVALAGEPVTALSSTGRGWRAIVDRRVVVDDTGAVHAEVPGAAVTCVTGHRGGALAGTDDAGLVRVDGHQVAAVAGFADAEGRRQWYTPWGGPPATRSLAAAPDGAWYVNVHVGGILRSRDEGRTWQQTVDIDVDVHQVVAGPPGTLVAACGVGGLAVSRDGGDSWRFDTEGLHATYCRAVAVVGGMVLLTAALGPGGGRAAIYRRRLDSDEAFERCTIGLPTWFDANIDTHRLAGADDLAAFAAADGRVFVSHDAGAEWTQADRADDISALVVL